MRSKRGTASTRTWRKPNGGGGGRRTKRLPPVKGWRRSRAFWTLLEPYRKARSAVAILCCRASRWDPSDKRSAFAEGSLRLTRRFAFHGARDDDSAGKLKALGWGLEACGWTFRSCPGKGISPPSKCRRAEFDVGVTLPGESLAMSAARANLPSAKRRATSRVAHKGR